MQAADGSRGLGLQLLPALRGHPARQPGQLPDTVEHHGQPRHQGQRAGGGRGLQGGQDPLGACQVGRILTRTGAQKSIRL